MERTPRAERWLRQPREGVWRTPGQRVKFRLVLTEPALTSVSVGTIPRGRRCLLHRQIKEVPIFNKVECFLTWFNWKIRSPRDIRRMPKSVDQIIENISLHSTIVKQTVLKQRCKECYYFFFHDRNWSSQHFKINGTHRYIGFIIRPNMSSAEGKIPLTEYKVTPKLKKWI